VEVRETSKFAIFLASELEYQLELVIQGNQVWMPEVFRVHSLLLKLPMITLH